jgi:hypothetical protein
VRDFRIDWSSSMIAMSDFSSMCFTVKASNA